MSIEAMKLALEALEAHADLGIKSDKAITALRTAIAEAEKQEPVAKYIGECKDGSLVQLYADVKKGTDFYTTPPAQPEQPAPVQEPVAEVVWGAKTGFEWKFKMLVELACVEDVPVKLYAGPFKGAAMYWHDTETDKGTTPPAPVQPEQEPVAEVLLKKTGGNVGIATVIHEIYSHYREPLRPGDKLYTTPPAAQSQCKWPTCQSDEYQQALAEQINQELVTGAAQRQWVGLTDEERGKVYADWRWSDGRTSNLALCKYIEAKLKDKNT